MGLKEKKNRALNRTQEKMCQITSFPMFFALPCTGRKSFIISWNEYWGSLFDFTRKAVFIRVIEIQKKQDCMYY